MTIMGHANEARPCKMADIFSIVDPPTLYCERCTPVRMLTIYLKNVGPSHKPRLAASVTRRRSRAAGLVGGTRQHHFDGTSFKPRKLLENAHCEASHQRRRGDIGCTSKIPRSGAVLARFCIHAYTFTAHYDLA
jgi:hypothetical protein